MSSAPALRAGALTAPIYLDRNASTPFDPRVIPCLEERFGNPSSTSIISRAIEHAPVTDSRRYLEKRL